MYTVCLFVLLLLLFQTLKYDGLADVSDYWKARSTTQQHLQVPFSLIREIKAKQFDLIRQLLGIKNYSIRYINASGAEATILEYFAKATSYVSIFSPEVEKCNAL